VVFLQPAVRHRAVRAVGLLVVLGFAGLVGLWSHEHSPIALLLAISPLVAVLAFQPRLAVVLGAFVLPFLSIGLPAGPVQITASDALFTVAFAGVVLALLVDGSWAARARDARPLILCSAPLAVWLVIVMAEHGTPTVLVNSLQSYQLFLVPLLLGALVPDRRAARWAMAAFVVASVALAVTWIVSGGDGLPLSGNKNPSGQFIANAMILVLALAPTWTWRLVLLVPLGAGLVFTQSRGALLGAGVGIIVLLLLRGLGSWRRTIAAALALVALTSVGYRSLPPEVLSRTTDFSSGASGDLTSDLTAAQYSVQLRDVFRTQGRELIDAHPVFGVGPGKYRTGNLQAGTATVDPHNVIIRTAGDLGYPGLVAFGILIVGTVVVAFRRRSVNPYAVVALAVQAAVIVHGFVDVYWVRGTPVLPWLLLGMAINRGLDLKRE
jgi:hypothetical protein